jgi:hypothetical protein
MTVKCLPFGRMTEQRVFPCAVHHNDNKHQLKILYYLFSSYSLPTSTCGSGRRQYYKRPCLVPL